MSDVYVMGDVHGHLATVVGLLREGGLIDSERSWCGGRSMLWFIGDLVDRGPDGVGVIALAMRLQREAAAAGGAADAIIGNHDVLLLGAYRFGLAPSSGPGGTFHAAWLENGGEAGDLERLTPEQAEWLGSRPAMARVGDDLLMHADARLYLHYGRSIAEVNEAFQVLIGSDEVLRWDRLLDEFSEHRAFVDGGRGAARARAMLQRFGGTRIAHGHSPISSITKKAAETVTTPLSYQDGLCLDVDGGIYLGGRGFLYRLQAR